MDCDKCDERGYIKKSYNYIDKAFYVPCEKCGNDCAKCGSKGWYYQNQDDKKKAPCGACWIWETCENCGGAGEFIEERYNAKLNGTVSDGYVCQRCNGNGTVCVGWGREDSTEPQVKPSSFVDVNI